MCGSVGVVMALSGGRLTTAFCLMILAAVFDFFDGFVARLLGQSSPIGLQLDSLSDDISFGLLPASILYVLYGRIAVVVAGAVRPGGGGGGLCGFRRRGVRGRCVWRSSISTTRSARSSAACPRRPQRLLCGSLGLLAERNGLVLPREAVLAVAAAAAWLMVSGIRMFALKFHGFGWRGNELRYSFLAAGAAMIVLLRGYAVPLVIALYVVVSFVRGLACRTNQ